MSAKDMFEKLGYKQNIVKNENGKIYIIEYIKKKSRGYYSYYEFWIIKKEIFTSYYEDYFNLHHDYTFKPKCIPFNQLKAVIQQCKELEWLDE